MVELCGEGGALPLQGFDGHLPEQDEALGNPVPGVVLGHFHAGVPQQLGHIPDEDAGQQLLILMRREYDGGDLPAGGVAERSGQARQPFAAAALGIAQTYLPAIERDLKKPGATILFTVARLCGKSIVWLVTGGGRSRVRYTA